MIPAWLAQSFYVGLFVGVIAIGEGALIPAVYVGFVSDFSIPAILGVAFGATMLADGFWYSVGYLVPQEKLMQYNFFARQLKRTTPLRSFFENNKLRILFYSKFFYSTRIVFQLLAGMSNVKLTSYLLINTLSTILWLLLITALGALLGRSVASLENLVYGIEIAITATVIIMILLYAGGKWALRRIQEKHSSPSQKG